MAANHQIEYYESTAEIDYNTLYCRRVRNVDGFDVTQAKLTEWFEHMTTHLRKERAWGRVRVIIPRERQGPKYASFYAFVQFEHPEYHHEVVEALDKARFMGVEIDLSYKMTPGMLRSIPEPAGDEQYEPEEAIDREEEPVYQPVARQQKGPDMSLRVRNDALMAQVLELLAEKSALKAELQRKNERIAELEAELQRKDGVIRDLEKKANTRKKVAERLEESAYKD